MASSSKPPPYVMVREWLEGVERPSLRADLTLTRPVDPNIIRWLSTVYCAYHEDGIESDHPNRALPVERHEDYEQMQLTVNWWSCHHYLKPRIRILGSRVVVLLRYPLGRKAIGDLYTDVVSRDISESVGSVISQGDEGYESSFISQVVGASAFSIQKGLRLLRERTQEIERAHQRQHQRKGLRYWWRKARAMG